MASDERSTVLDLALLTTRMAPMKNVYEVLLQKHSEIQRVQTEIEALHSVIPLLVDEGDWFEQGVIVGFFSCTTQTTNGAKRTG